MLLITREFERHARRTWRLGKVGSLSHVRKYPELFGNQIIEGWPGRLELFCGV